MRTCFILLSLFISQYSNAQDSVLFKKHSVGDSVMGFHLSIYYPHSSQVSFVNLHDDENTSVDAGLDFLSRYGGSLMQLQHSGKRHFDFNLDSRAFAFDPNRIFTSDGLQATLAKQSTYSEDAASEVKRMADSILMNYVDNKKLVIALHNNTERGLSILSYKKGGFEYKNAAKVYVNHTINPHDFILTTESSIYHHLKRNKINVVLQRSEPADDGSLSVYAARNNIPYINVEALHGHLVEQIKMLEALKDIIFRY